VRTTGVSDVKDLEVWQTAMALCKAIYVTTAALPAAERFGLTAQMRRAAVSIPSNLAEGYGRGTGRDYRQFVYVARGSACELETQVILAEALGFLAAEQAEELLRQAGMVLRMLSGLARSLEPREPR